MTTITRWPETAKHDDFYVALLVTFLAVTGAFTLVTGIVTQWREEQRIVESQARADARHAEEKKRAAGTAEVSETREKSI